MVLLLESKLDNIAAGGEQDSKHILAHMVKMEDEKTPPHELHTQHEEGSGVLEVSAHISDHERFVHRIYSL